VRPNPTAALLAACAVAVAVIGAVVGLDVSGQQGDVATVLGIGGPLIAGLLAIARVDSVTAGQNSTLEQHGQQLATITAQTNGVLDKRIRDGVTIALHAAGLVPSRRTADMPVVAAAVAPSITPPPAPSPEDTGTT
jgi:hypothetical protein